MVMKLKTQYISEIGLVSIKDCCLDVYKLISFTTRMKA